MRRIVFRVLAGLLALAFAALLVFGDTSQMSLRVIWGIGAVAAGFGLYAVLGSELAHSAACGGRDRHGRTRSPCQHHVDVDDVGAGCRHVPRRLHISGIELGVVHRPRLLPDVLTERATRCRPPDAGLPRQALELEDRMPEDSTEPDVLADVHDPAYLIG